MPKTKSKRFIPPPVPHSLYKRILGRYNRLFSMYQQLLEENNELRMEKAARPTRIDK